MNFLYNTISATGEGLYKDKGSRFRAFAFHTETTEEIKTYLLTLKKKYHDASHHCYAWRLGTQKNQHRVNDDGEPSGSAGKPIFGQIVSRDLTNVLVVVVRYFGGTLLGVGGLINAYRTSASNALDNAIPVQRKVYSHLKLEFEYSVMNDVMKVIKAFRIEQYDQMFELSCSVKLKLWEQERELIIDKLNLIKDCKISVIA